MSPRLWWSASSYPSAVTSLLEMLPDSKVVLNPGEAGNQFLLPRWSWKNLGSNKQLNGVHPVMQNALGKLQKEQGSSKKSCFLPKWSSLKKQLLGCTFFQASSWSSEDALLSKCFRVVWNPEIWHVWTGKRWGKQPSFTWLLFKFPCPVLC